MDAFVEQFFERCSEEESSVRWKEVEVLVEAVLVEGGWRNVNFDVSLHY